MYTREIIQQYLNDQRINNPKYSLRMLANQLGIAPGALSAFLSGKRNFSKKMSVRVMENLAQPPEVVSIVERKYLEEKSKEVAEAKSDLGKIELSSTLYYLLTDPLYYSYLCLIETSNFKDSDAFAAKRLSTSTIKIAKIKATLLKLKLIHYNDNGQLDTTKNVLQSTDNIPNYSIKIRHQQNMEDAKRAVTAIDTDKRYFASETLSFDEADLPLVQSKINQLMDDLIWLSQKGSDKKHVYEFGAQYFPRTK